MGGDIFNDINLYPVNNSFRFYKRLSYTPSISLPKLPVPKHVPTRTSTHAHTVFSDLVTGPGGAFQIGQKYNLRVPLPAVLVPVYTVFAAQLRNMTKTSSKDKAAFAMTTMGSTTTLLRFWSRDVTHFPQTV